MPEFCGHCCTAHGQTGLVSLVSSELLHQSYSKAIPHIAFEAHHPLVKMNIAGHKFRLLKSPILYSVAGVYVYKHKTSGKCFVKPMRNCRLQKSKNNFPVALKDYLKDNPSEVAIYLTELPVDTKDALHLASRSVADDLSERGLLYKHDEKKANIYRRHAGEADIPFALYRLTHIDTGAVFYFYEQVTVDVIERISARFASFNNYAARGIMNPNRAMHNFVKHRYPLNLTDWVMVETGERVLGENKIRTQLTQMCKAHLQEGTVVLNRVCDMDVLYYRNAVLGLKHMSMQEYLANAL